MLLVLIIVAALAPRRTTPGSDPSAARGGR